MASGFLTLPFGEVNGRLKSVAEAVSTVFTGVECFFTSKPENELLPHISSKTRTKTSNSELILHTPDKSLLLEADHNSNSKPIIFKDESDSNKEDHVGSTDSSKSHYKKASVGEVVLFFQTPMKDDSQEIIERAKRFAKFHLTPQEDYITCTEQLKSPAQLAMVLRCSRNLQDSTLALIAFDPHNCEITFQGPQQNVNDARAHVDVILEKLEQTEDGKEKCDGNGKTVSNVSCESLQSWNSSSLGPTFCSTGRFSDVFQSSGQSSSIDNHFSCDCNNLSNRNTCGEPAEDNNYENQGLHGDVKRESSVSYFSSSSILDSVGTENVLTDPYYNQRVEDALKLGYSEGHVKRALTKLGPNCAKNDLLSELIKIGSEDQQHEEESSGDLRRPSFNSLLEQDFVFGQRLHLSGQQAVEQSSSQGTQDLAADFQESVSLRSGAHANLDDSSNLRPIIIDGSNVAMSHGKNVFSCRGIKIVVDWFRQRGHKEITAFVPQWRKETSRPDAPIIDQEILTELEKEKILVFTPARRVKGHRVVCYDDRYILKLAVETEGIVVSNDVYRDLYTEKEEFRKVVDSRLLVYTFAQDRFMPPEDPYGRSGPSLDNLLRKNPSEPAPRPQDCPYGKKCTYGNKCRFYHPERGFAPQKSVTDMLKEQADIKIQERASKMSEMAAMERGRRPKQKLTRTRSLVPGEPLPQNLYLEARKEKPRLTHSKSLVAPSNTKTPEYLDESRKKLEEAEAAEIEKASLQDVTPAAQEASSVSISSSKDRRKQSLGDDLGSAFSHLQEKEIVKAAVTATNSMPGTTSPIKTLGTKSPCASPSHLTVPNKRDESERYVSGHLLLAKNLSDECSDHPSSPSSTRTSSPVIPVSKRRGGSEHSSRENLLDDTPSPTRLQLMEKSQSSHNALPNLSILQQDLSMGHTSQTSRGRFGSQEFLESLPENGQSNFPLGELVPNLSIMNSSSMGSMSCDVPREGFTPKYPSPTPVLRSSTSAIQGQSRSTREASMTFQKQQDHHNMVDRSYSSTSNVNKYSESTFPVVTAHHGEHLALRPQFSVPLLQKPTQQRRQSQPQILNRQNSSSDPQLHCGNPDLGPFFPLDRSYFQQHQPHRQTQEEMLQLRQRQQQQQLFQQQKKQQEQHQHLLQQYQNDPWPDSQSFPPNLPPSPYRVIGNRHSDTSSYHQRVQMDTQQPPPGYNSHFNMGPVYYPQTSQTSQSSYQQKYHMVQGEPSPPSINFYQQQPPPPPPPQFPNPAPTPMRYVLPGEDDPILPDDPRHSIYYHLSSLFGEVAVRRVLNKHPTVLKPEHLCPLIIQFKQNSGV